VPLLDNVRPVLDPGEQLKYALTGQTGINPGFLWLPLLRWLVVTNRARIIVITDRRIAVFAAGQLRWARNKPRHLLLSLPPHTRLEHGQGSRSKIAVGEEMIWVTRATYAILDEANATAGPAPTSQ
jgi:hypothetical protein